MAARERGGALGDEKRLVELAQGGDRQAFAVLIDRYWNSLYRWLYHLSHDRHTAEDLVQETLLKAFAGLSSFTLDAGTMLGCRTSGAAHEIFFISAVAQAC